MSYGKFQLRRDTAANWLAANPVLADGEIGIETDVQPYKMKIGDGVTPWSDLPFWGGTATPDGVFLIVNRLSELTTENAKSEARANLGLQVIDGGTFN